MNPQMMQMIMAALMQQRQKQGQAPVGGPGNMPIGQGYGGLTQRNPFPSVLGGPTLGPGGGMSIGAQQGQGMSAMPGMMGMGY